MKIQEERDMMMRDFYLFIENSISVKTLMLVWTPNFKLQLNCFYSNLSKCKIRVNEAQ